MYLVFSQYSVPALVPYKRKQSACSVSVDYFAPIQKVLGNQKTAFQLLSDKSKSKSDLNNITKETSLKKKKNRKRARTSDNSDVANSSSDKETGTNLCTKSKKERRSLRKFQRSFDIDNGNHVSPETTTPKSSAFGTNYNIQNSSFTENIPTMCKEELMGRFFKSFLNDPSEPVADDTVLKVSSMLSHDNKHQYKVPNPNADDYLESLQKRWWC